MFLLLNGSFGIGKTTAAKALVAALPSASVYDPEPAGVLMQRALACIGGGRRVDDFQDLKAWRRLTAWGARRRHRFTDSVIVPMAFSNLAYLDELASALRTTARVRTFCLVAPLDVIEERLAKRARTERKPVAPWVLRRAAECCEAHTSSAFGHPIDATAPPTDIMLALIAASGMDLRQS